MAATVNEKRSNAVVSATPAAGRSVESAALRAGRSRPPLLPGTGWDSRDKRCLPVQLALAHVLNDVVRDARAAEKCRVAPAGVTQQPAVLEQPAGCNGTSVIGDAVEEVADHQH